MRSPVTGVSRPAATIEVLWRSLEIISTSMTLALGPLAGTDLGSKPIFWLYKTL